MSGGRNGESRGAGGDTLAEQGLRRLCYLPDVMTIREQVYQALEGLTDAQLVAVAHIVEALRSTAFPARRMDRDFYGPLYRQFAAEDSALAEEGLGDFSRSLAAEDRA